MGDGDAWGPDHLQRMGLHLRPAGTRDPHLAVPRAEQTDPGQECGPKTCRGPGQSTWTGPSGSDPTPHFPKHRQGWGCLGYVSMEGADGPLHCTEAFPPQDELPQEAPANQLTNASLALLSFVPSPLHQKGCTSTLHFPKSDGYLSKPLNIWHSCPLPLFQNSLFDAWGTTTTPNTYQALTGPGPFPAPPPMPASP